MDGIGSGSLHANGNDIKKNLETEWEMGMLVWEWGRMGIWNPFPLTSNFGPSGFKSAPQDKFQATTLLDINTKFEN